MSGVDDVRSSALLVRGAIGGALMGLANLVPGISGGTLLLAVGIYPAFVAALAELTTLRVRARPLLLVASVVGTAALAILGLAGPMRALVVGQRWMMYSLFIGLTLGGVPLVLRAARGWSRALVAGAIAGLALMLALGLWGAPGAARADGGYASLALAGVAGASAMLLPGVSGGYLLLVLGQYERILGAVDQVAVAVLAVDPAPLLGVLHVIAPVAAGVLVGVAAVSNLIRWLLARFRRPTLGVLLGLLLGAVIGLWPFQRAVEPDGSAERESSGARVDPAEWPLVPFRPGPGQVGAALGLVALGFGATLLVDRLSVRLETHGRVPAEEAG